LTITAIGVHERQREIGVIRSVGASSRAIIRQFLLEGVLVGLIAWIAGLPLSYLFGDLLIDTVPFGDVIVFRYSLLAPFMGLAGMLLVALAATLYPAQLAARKTVSEILRYQ
jgi:ABC-type antimicrobial peptide transport system permease subunit